MSIIVLPKDRVDEFVELVFREDESVALRLRDQYGEWASQHMKAGYRCQIRTFTNRERTLFGAEHILVFDDVRDAVLFKLWWL